MGLIKQLNVEIAFDVMRLI